MNKNINVILTLKDQFSGGIRSAAERTKGLSREAKAATNTISNLGNRANKAFGGIAKAAAGAGAVVGAAIFKSSLDTYAEFEQSMANVKALTGATGAEFQDLQNAALEMGKKTSKTAKEAADALGYMSLAGWDAKTSIAALEPVLRLSEAGNLDLARTSDLVTDSMSALGLTVDELPGYLDKLAQSGRRSNTAIDQMMDAYLKVGGTMNRLNVPMEESATVLGMLANRGLKGAEAGQALSSVMVNLTAPTGQAATALKKLGFSAFDSKGNFKGLENVLFELQDKMSGLNQQERESMIAMIAGKEQLKTFSAVLDGLGSEYYDLKGEIASSDGALMDMANTMNDTLLGAFKRAQGAIDNFKVVTMAQLAPYLTPLINQFAEELPNATEKFSTSLGQGIEKAMPAIKAAGRLVGFLGNNLDTIIPLVVNLTGAWVAYNATMKVSSGIRAASAFSKGILSIGREIGVLSTVTVQGRKTALALKGITAAVGLLKAAFLANPFGMIVLGITATVTAVILLRKNWDKVTGKISSGVQFMQGKLQSFADLLASIRVPKWLTDLSQKVAGLGDKFGEALNKANQFIFGANKAKETSDSFAAASRGSGAGRIPRHATGTPYFAGGLTKINEGGRGEIVDLPNGTRIIPHDISRKQQQTEQPAMPEKEQKKNIAPAAGITVNINVQGNMIGNEQYAQYIGNVIGQKIKMACANL